jgi:hypothetical protein
MKKWYKELGVGAILLGVCWQMKGLVEINCKRKNKGFNRNIENKNALL